MSRESHDISFAVVGAGLGIYMFWNGFRKLKLQKLISAIATSKVRSLALGTVELSGVTRMAVPLVDPINGAPCVFYRISIEEYRTRGKHSRWVNIHQVDSANHPFFLVDDTGAVPVFCSGAEFCGYNEVIDESGLFQSLELTSQQYIKNALGRDPNGFFSNAMRVSALIICENEPIYLLGFASGEKEPLTISKKITQFVSLSINELGNFLKSDSERMKKLDTNNDNQVDESEWMVGLKSLKDEVERQNKDLREETKYNIAVHQNSGSPFLIAPTQEGLLKSNLNTSAWLNIIGGPVICLTSIAYLAWRFRLIDFDFF